MENYVLHQPELTGREEELSNLKNALDRAIQGESSTIFISGEAGIGKTRIVSELINDAESKNVQIIQGWCLTENMEPLMPVKTAFKDAGMQHLISGDPPPLVVSAYLMNSAGMLIAKAEREQMNIDSDIFAGMLQAVGNFVQDSLSMMDGTDMGNLNSLGYGEYTIQIQIHDNLSMATVIKGASSEFLLDDMRQFLMDNGSEFNNWIGDMASAKKLEPKIAWFLNSGKYEGKFLVDDPKIRQENLFDNILLGIERASYDKPVLMFIDDLQWSDPTSLGLIHYLSRNTRNNQILILGTYRPEDILEMDNGKTHHLETTMQNMTREHLLEEIALERLGPEETGKIINSILGKTNFEQEFLDRVYSETGGTPFFVLEVIKMLAQEELIQQNAEDVWNLSSETETLDIPSKIYDVIKRRLNRLQKDQRKILECASIIGESFTTDILTSITGINRIQILEQLNEIQNSHRLISSSNKIYHFGHAKIREVLYIGIMDELRQEYHLMIGEILEDKHKDDIDEVMGELAHHFYEAGDKKAGPYLLRAGDDSKEKYANAEAIQFYERALRFLSNSDKPDIFEKLGDIRLIIGEYEKAIYNFEAAKELSQDNEINARMLRKMAHIKEREGNYDDSLALLSQAKEILGTKELLEYARILVNEGEANFAIGETNLALSLYLEAMDTFKPDSHKDIGDTLRAIGGIHRHKGEYDLCLKYYEKSQKIMKEIEYHTGLANGFHGLALVYYNKGEFEQALECIRQNIEINENIGDKPNIARILNINGIIYYLSGKTDEALKCYERALKIWMKIGNKASMSVLYDNIGIIHIYNGELKQALKYCMMGLENSRDVGNKNHIATNLFNVGEVYFRMGDVKEAMDYFEECHILSEDTDNKRVVVSAISSKAIVYHSQGDYDIAQEFFQKALNMCIEIGLKGQTIENLHRLAELYIDKKEMGKALEHAEKALGLSLETKSESNEGISHRILGSIFRDLGKLEKANKEFELAGEISNKLGSKEEQARLIFEHGLLLRAQGKVEEAKKELETAQAMYEEMGMKLWVEKVRGSILEG